MQMAGGRQGDAKGWCLNRKFLTADGMPRRGGSTTEYTEYTEPGVIAVRKIHFRLAGCLWRESHGLRRRLAGDSQPHPRRAFAGPARGREACPQASAECRLACFPEIGFGKRYNHRKPLPTLANDGKRLGPRRRAGIEDEDENENENENELAAGRAGAWGRGMDGRKEAQKRKG
jgi:hypothetical protein